MDLFFRPWIKNIASANTPYNFCCAGDPFTFLYLSFTFVPLFEFNLVTPEAEKFNGWMAMIGFIAAFGAYATTGQIIPGLV